ncbi:MAG: hypothetical protein M3460_05620 [Actinomycetota bacterium]|nr:hypothetical protein [Actinomycetota bacterium]
MGMPTSSATLPGLIVQMLRHTHIRHTHIDDGAEVLDAPVRDTDARCWLIGSVASR